MAPWRFQKGKEQDGGGTHPTAQCWGQGGKAAWASTARHYSSCKARPVADFKEPRELCECRAGKRASNHQPSYPHSTWALLRLLKAPVWSSEVLAWAAELEKSHCHSFGVCVWETSSHGPRKKKLCLSKLCCGRLHGSCSAARTCTSFTTATDPLIRTRQPFLGTVGS